MLPLFASLLCYLLCIAHLVVSSPLTKRDADFNEVKTRLESSNQKVEASKPDKYFHECAFHQHYDGRFADKPLSYDMRQVHLRALIRTYLATMNDIGIETFLMHGTLLGWWWNRKIMPWDSDIDVMISEKSIHHMAAYYNMTVHHHRIADSGVSRDYLLEVNPHYTSSDWDTDNKIDARWIDTDSGLFIDITTLRRNTTAEKLGIHGAMSVKDKHHYDYDDIFPLRITDFEGSPAKVPYAYGEILVEEYGQKALTDIYFEGHRFDSNIKQWVPLRWADLPPMQASGPRLRESYWGSAAREYFAQGN